MQHTPAPWLYEIGSNLQLFIKSADEKLVCTIFEQLDAGRSEANARLIAAAPDVTKELKTLVLLLEPALERGLSIPGLATLNAAKAALAKAEPNGPFATAA